MSEGISGQQLQAPLVLTWPKQPASYSFGTGNSGVVFTAVEAGVDGNDINVNVLAASQDEPLSVEVDGTIITIQPETSGSFDSLSTALEMMNAVNADPEASLLVLGTLADGSDGSEIVEDSGWDHDLIGGLDAGTVTFPAYFASDNQLLIFNPDTTIGGVDNTLELTGDVIGSGAAAPGSIETTLADTEVVPGTYTNPVIIVDSKGRITGAADGVDENEQKLATVEDVDLNTATPTTLFTMPDPNYCQITKVVLRRPSTSLTTASISFGWNSPDFHDVIADAAHTELINPNLYTVLSPRPGAGEGSVGGSGSVFKVRANTLQGAAATVTIDVFGYFIPA